MLAVVVAVAVLVSITKAMSNIAEATAAAVQGAMEKDQAERLEQMLLPAQVAWVLRVVVALVA